MGVMVLPMLFDDSCFQWGGNALSALIGEFS
jgi:hypothetical protein